MPELLRYYLGDKYQIRLTRSTFKCYSISGPTLVASGILFREQGFVPFFFLLFLILFLLFLYIYVLEFCKTVKV